MNGRLRAQGESELTNHQWYEKTVQFQAFQHVLANVAPIKKTMPVTATIVYPDASEL